MADVNIGETISQLTPKINFGGIVGTITWGIVIILILTIIAVVTFVIMNRKKYKNQIVIFEKINGVPQDTGKDRACEISLNKGGDTVFYLQKRKKYLATPRIQSGKRKFYFYIREDGEWLNFSLADFDDSMRKLNAHFLDKEMRYARTQLQRGLKERYETKNFLKEYAPMIISIMFIVIVGVFTWLLFDKWLGLAQATNDGVKTAGEVMKLAKEILGNLDNIRSGGSGIVPVAS